MGCLAVELLLRDPSPPRGQERHVSGGRHPRRRSRAVAPGGAQPHESAGLRAVLRELHGLCPSPARGSPEEARVPRVGPLRHREAQAGEADDPDAAQHGAGVRRGGVPAPLQRLCGQAPGGHRRDAHAQRRHPGCQERVLPAAALRVLRRRDAERESRRLLPSCGRRHGAGPPAPLHPVPAGRLPRPRARAIGQRGRGRLHCRLCAERRHQLRDLGPIAEPPQRELAEPLRAVWRRWSHS
mmetsp:Transcript_37822/g.102352  ORF Transcript_37822/g.102352 Transcript_37822/m.102352 type:complete len:240 (-) Transcript_37822:311-1030(-)